MTQRALSRRWARPTAVPRPNLPLARSTPELGWKLQWLVGRFTVEHDISQSNLEKKLRWGWDRFVRWMEAKGHRYQGGFHLSGPYYHVELTGVTGLPQRAGLFYARDIPRSLEDSAGAVDYKVGGWFVTREQLIEVLDDNSGHS